MKPMSVWISYKGRLIRMSIEVLMLRCWKMNGASQTLREGANAIPTLWWRRDDITAHVSLRAAVWWMSAVRIINCRGQFIPVKRPTLRENHLRDNTHFTRCLQHTFPFLSEFYICQTGGIIKLFSQVSCGPRWWEGIAVRTASRGKLQQRPR